jgi:hypothetical protein
MFNMKSAINEDFVWKTTVVKPVDILDAIKTIDGDGLELSLVPENWANAHLYLSWAKAELENDNPFGWEKVVNYAKKTVCRLIDGLLLNNYFGKYLGSNYPKKIKLLQTLGIEIPDLVHDWIIHKRNKIEHDYQLADKKQAKNAVEIAGLFLAATTGDAARKPFLIGGTSIVCRFGSGWPGDHVEKLNRMRVNGNPFVFFDSHEDHKKSIVKIIYPIDMEIRSSQIKEFSEVEMIEFSKIMRKYKFFLEFAKPMIENSGLSLESVMNYQVMEAFKKRLNVD